MKIIEVNKEYFSSINKSVNSDAYNISTYTNVNPITFYDSSKENVYQLVKSRLRSQGYCVIQYMGSCSDHRIIYEKILFDFFGEPVREKNFDARPYADIQATENARFYVSSNVAQPVHTDEGHAVAYPKHVALYCDKEATIGGDSIVVLLNGLLLSLISEFGADVDLLYMKDALTVENYQGEKKKPILIKFENSDIGISFSTVLYKIRCSEKVFNMYDHIAKYVNAIENQIRFKLQEKQLLLFNNCNVLHGRTGFSKNEPRLLSRYWYEWRKL